jgi:hypothetical protein
VLATRSFAPSFTVMTADKDDPRFDVFYRSGNEARLFTALFLPDMPSYMGLGFELRDRHDTPAPNEHYTKLFVFQRETGPTARTGPYVWGRNHGLFARLERIRALADLRRGFLRGATVTFLRPPDPTGAELVLAWALEDASDGVAGERLLCVVNFGLFGVPAFGVPGAALGDPAVDWEPVFSTDDRAPLGAMLAWSGRWWRVPGLGGGEARLYRGVVRG